MRRMFSAFAEEGDPEQLERWKSAATRVTLAGGEPKTMTLKLNR